MMAHELEHPDGGRGSALLSLCLACFLALFLLSASIAAPILCRPFYYAHIQPLELERAVGLDAEEIRRAYDEMLDFCLGLRTDFSTGRLPWSESGRAHFVDVRGLFLLDLGILGGSSVLLLLTLLLLRRFHLCPRRFLGRGPGFWAAAGLGGAFVVLALAAARDFDRAFVVFHSLFFPGKTNWIFDARTDAIILILPEVFFRNCALLIVGLLLLGSAVLIVTDLLLPRRGRRPA